jgi:hypothetical protein
MEAGVAGKRVSDKVLKPEFPQPLVASTLSVPVVKLVGT